jgi:hypothetical protein
MALASSERRSAGVARAVRAQRVALVVLLGAVLWLPCAAAISVSHQDAMRIGRQVWQNECGGSVAGLTSWNAGENFASLGIGHFIWYPAGVRGPFEESFPLFLRYVEMRGAKLPQSFLGPNKAVCPWNSRRAFLAARSTPKMKELRNFLADTIDLQADFLVERLRTSLPRMVAIAPADQRPKIEERFDRLGRRAEGCYALIDYVNFKGEGVLATERYEGRGWGLLQVLEGMPNQSGASLLDEFADSAERVLRERVRNAPPERDEERWLAGWLKRVNSYR